MAGELRTNATNMFQRSPRQIDEMTHEALFNIKLRTPLITLRIHLKSLTNLMSLVQTTFATIQKTGTFLYNMRTRIGTGRQEA